MDVPGQERQQDPNMGTAPQRVIVSRSIGQEKNSKRKTVLIEVKFVFKNYSFCTTLTFKALSSINQTLKRTAQSGLFYNTTRI